MSLVSCKKSIMVSSAVVMFMAASPAGAIVINGLDDAGDGAYRNLAAQYASVGQFHSTDGTYRYSASGVAIAANWVLTAGHVAAGMNTMDFYRDDGGDFSSFASRSADSATSWITHPKWSGNLASGYDIALVYFEANDPVFTDIASLYQGSNELGKTGTMVGYGTTGTGATGGTTFDGKKRAGENVIDALYDTPGKKRDPDRILLADFDSGDESDNSFGSKEPLPLEAMIASGDSGGGLFIDDAACEGMPCLAGITSFGWGRLDGDPNSDFGDVGGFTRVSALYDWIVSVINPPVSDGSGGGNSNGKKGGPKKTSANSFGATSVRVNVPEPGTLALFGIGLVGLALIRRRKAA